MTFTEIVDAVCSRLNYTSAEAIARVGKSVNDRHRRITSTLGLNVSRRTTVQTAATIGVSTLVFTGIEKLINVTDRSGGSYRILNELTMEEMLRMQPFASSDSPSNYAILNMGTNTVTVLLDCVPATAFDLYADGMGNATTLSGAQTPVFGESFHHILVDGVLADEYRKLEKVRLAEDSTILYDRGISDLRMFIAKSSYGNIIAGKTRGMSNTTGAAGSGSGSGSTTGSTSYTQTGLITFDRTSAIPDVPFAVAAGSDKVANLDADLLDGEEGTAYHATANLTGSDIVNSMISAAAAIGWTKVSKTGSSLADLITRSATDLTSGTLPDARFPATLPAISGANLTNLPIPADVVMTHICDGRLTLTTAVPVTSADVTAATSIYFTPYKGNQIALYDGSGWDLHTLTERTLALGTLTNDLPYDVYIYDNAGTLTLEAVAWTNKTTRATALATQNGVYVKTGTLTKRYLGTFHTTSTTTTEDSFAKRLLWNYYNRAIRGLRIVEATNTWTYSTGTIRQANASVANQLAVVVGVAEVLIEADVMAMAKDTSAAGAATMIVGVGEDSTTVIHVHSLGRNVDNAGAGVRSSVISELRTYPAVGYHFYAWLEYAATSGTTTWFGDNGALLMQAGMHGWIEG